MPYTSDPRMPRYRPDYEGPIIDAHIGDRRYRLLVSGLNNDQLNLVMDRRRRRKGSESRFTVMLTEMTVEELEAFVQVVADMADLARPICAARDAISQDYQDDITIEARAIRNMPEVVVSHWDRPAYLDEEE